MTILVGKRLWKIKMVLAEDPILTDRTGKQTLGVTDTATQMIYLADTLYGKKLRKVFMHEVGHAILASYGLLDDIHRVVPRKYWVLAEEWLCNFVADYSEEAASIAARFDKEFAGEGGA